MKRESNAPKRHIGEVFHELSPQRKTLRVKADRKLYPVVVTDVTRSESGFIVLVIVCGTDDDDKK